MKRLYETVHASKLVREFAVKRGFIVLLAIPFLAACIQTESPLSTEKYQDKELLGHWVSVDNSKSVMELDIAVGKDGSYEIEERERNNGKPTNYVATITHGKRTNYLNVVMPRDKQKDAYMLFQYGFDKQGQELRVLGNNFDKLKAEIDAKKISGNSNETTWGRNMLITTSGAQLLSIFDAADGAKYFSEELIFKRGKDLSSEISATLQSQADAWNAGNLDAFMTAYLKSPDISFVSADGEMRGYDALEQRYRKKYGSSRDTMGKLSFSDLRVQRLGDQNALCVGHWLVERDGQPKLQGMFSLVLKLVDGKWKIIHDHTSLFTK